MAYVRRNVYSYDGCNVCTYFAYITHIRIIITINVLMKRNLLLAEVKDLADPVVVSVFDLHVRLRGQVVK